MNEKSYSPDDFSILAKNKEKLETFKGYMVLKHKYSAAIGEVRTKLEILNEEFRIRYDHNPIHHIESRLKSPESMFSKLERYNVDISIESAIENLYDIAGIRVVCCYIDDVYKVADILTNQDDIVLIKKKDYIKNPKPNGYRSLHLVLQIPIFLSDHTEKIPVEVQFRTIAMDMWASLEHKLRYKQTKALPRALEADLQKRAEEIAQIDQKLQKIYYEIQDI